MKVIFCIGIPSIRLLLFHIVKEIWCTCKSPVSFCLESLNIRNQLVLFRFQNFEHKVLVCQIFIITLWSASNVCLACYLHIIDPKVLLGVLNIIQIGWKGFDLISLRNIIWIGCLVKVFGFVVVYKLGFRYFWGTLTQVYLVREMCRLLW